LDGRSRLQRDGKPISLCEPAFNDVSVIPAMGMGRWCPSKLLGRIKSNGLMPAILVQGRRDLIILILFEWVSVLRSDGKGHFNGAGALDKPATLWSGSG